MTQLPLQLPSRQAWSVIKSHSLPPSSSEKFLLSLKPLCYFFAKRLITIIAFLHRVAASLNWRSAETTGKRLDFSLACEWMGLFKLQQQEALKQKTFNIVYCALDEVLWCGILIITVQSHFTVCWSCKITRDCMWLVGHCLQPQDGWL